MYVCTYGTAKLAANILCTEVLYNVALGWIWSYTNNIFSLYSVWQWNEKGVLFTELALNTFSPNNNNKPYTQPWPTVQLAVPLQWLFVVCCTGCWYSVHLCDYNKQQHYTVHCWCWPNIYRCHVNTQQYTLLHSAISTPQTYLVLITHYHNQQSLCTIFFCTKEHLNVILNAYGLKFTGHW
jgi:hypothetical protein